MGGLVRERVHRRQSFPRLRLAHTRLRLRLGRCAATSSGHVDERSSIEPSSMDTTSWIDSGAHPSAYPRSGGARGSPHRGPAFRFDRRLRFAAARAGVDAGRADWSLCSSARDIRGRIQLARLRFEASRDQNGRRKSGAGSLAEMRAMISNGLRRSTDRVVSKLVTAATDAYFRRIYYSERWHPRVALLQRALDESVDYIESDMRDAIIRNDAFDVLTYALAQTRVDGLHLEFGVRTGSTINHIARRRRKTTIWGFDSFEGLPEPWAGYTLSAGAFRRNEFPDVDPNVELVVGWFDDTLPPFLERHPGDVAFVHVDSDIYSSAKTVLTNVGPRLRVGSVIVFNEYFNYPNWKQHEFRAWQEFCATHDIGYEYLCWALYEVAVRITSLGGVDR